MQLLEAAGVKISMAEAGQAWQNGYAERMMRTIKEEEVELSEYEDYWDACWQINQFLDDVYMLKRIHSSLGYLTPVELESHWLGQQGTLEVIHEQRPILCPTFGMQYTFGWQHPWIVGPQPVAWPL